MNALVSVVMPVYNCERFVAEAVDSALAQDHRAKEILVIDDGSKDGSRDVLARYGDAIRVIAVANGGPARARNIGMQEARGDYIAFLDADDVWLPGKLSAQVAHLQSRPEVGTCYTRWHVWAAEPDGVFRRPPWAQQPLGRPGPDAVHSGWIYDQLLFDCALLTTTVMIRTSVVREAGLFDESLRVGEDYDYWLRLSRLAQITRLDCTGALYRVVPSSASRRPHASNYELGVVRRATERFGLAGPDGRPVDRAALDARVRQLYFQHGYLHLKQGDPRIALDTFGESLREHPWQPRVWRHALQAWFRAAARRRPASTS